MFLTECYYASIPPKACVISESPWLVMLKQPTLKNLPHAVPRSMLSNISLVNKYFHCNDEHQHGQA